MTAERPVDVSLAVRDLVVGRDGAGIAGPFDFTLRPGDALVVTGVNGAGKSTLLRTLAGLLVPIRGRITVDGMNAADGEPARTAGEVAHYCGHANAMKPGLSVRANLAFWRRFLSGESAGNDDARIVAALDAFAIGDLADLACGYLSAGQKRRASLARLLAVERRLWLLDEPTGALDAASQDAFARIVERHRAAGGMVIAATHQPLGLRDASELTVTAAAPRDTEASMQAPADDDAALAAAEGWQ